MSEHAQGVLQRVRQGDGFLRDPRRSFRPDPQDVRVPASLIRAHALPNGALVTGPVRRHRREMQLGEVETIHGLSPEAFRDRPRFADLVPIDPHQRFHLSVTGDMSMRIVDLVAPLGRGTRALIVSPPKAGKTMLLEKIARAIHADAPDTRTIVLLLDERPEEVTHFRRAVDAEVLASSSDQSPQETVKLAEMTLAHLRLELECGRHVVLLIDSLTRMGRAFNLMGSGTGRTMSGGIEAGVLEVPRRFFGLARAIENGGSITIVATALIDTGSRMDQLIFEEFKGTGNSEVVLDRALAEARLFPAVNLNATGTRKEALLYTPEEGALLGKLRHILAGRRPEAALRGMLKLLEKYPTNEAFLRSGL